MTILYKIGFLALFIITVFVFGFVYGRELGKRAALQGAVLSFQKREKINNDISQLDDIELCIALGGMRDECGQLMPGLDKAPQGEQPPHDGTP